jgi:hypothetical protein
MADDSTPVPSGASPAGPSMSGFTTRRMWRAVTEHGEFSGSLASGIQRDMAAYYRLTRQFGPGVTELSPQIKVRPVIEKESGRLLNDPV